MTATNENITQLENQVVENVDNQLSSKLSHTGQVKWFNNKLGYGFIKIISDNSEDSDIFVHQTHIAPATSEYRSLSTGEYVSFNISGEDGNRQAVDVKGVNGGPLLVDNSIRRKPVIRNDKRSRPRNDRNTSTKSISENQ